MSDSGVCVFIIDDDTSVLEALSFLISSVGLRTKTYDSATAFLDAYDPDSPGCIVSDVRMPNMSGLVLQDKLIELGAINPLIFLTGHGDIHMAVEAVKKGAADFLTKPFRDQELLDSINSAIEVDAAKRLEKKQIAHLEKNLATLTKREHDVLKRVVSGQANKVIAVELNLSPRTVEVHRAHVMDKMQANSLAELVKQMHLIDSD
jgi:FixJ family two-component response regulator